MGWHLGKDVAYVAVRADTEVLLVQVGKRGLEFRGKHARVPQRLKGLMESTKPSKQIDELQARHGLVVQRECKLLGGVPLQQILYGDVDHVL